MTWHTADETLTVAALLERASRDWPERQAFEVDGVRVSYQELWYETLATARVFQDRGIRRGDSVAIQLPNRIEFLYAWFAASLLGALTVPINYHYKGDFLSNALNVSTAKVIVTDEKGIRELSAIAERVPSLTEAFSCDEQLESTDDLSVLTVSGLNDSVDPHRGRAPQITDPPQHSDPNLVLFTSGTTGASKAGIGSNHYVVHVSKRLTEIKDPCADDIFWTPLPMFHGNALFQTVLGPLSVGAQAVLEGKFSLSQFWSQIRNCNATQVSILGSMVALVWAQPPQADDADNAVRYVFAAPIPAEIHRSFEDRFGVRFLTGYGSGEAGMILLSSYTDPPEPGTCGKLYGDFDAKIVDDNDQEVPAGEVGEMISRPLKPYIMFDGYLNDAAAYAGTLRNLWFHTGDYCRRRPDGRYEFVDRKKDVIRRRGENVSSWEVEQVILSHSKVADAAAFAVPSEITEDEIVVAVVLGPGETMAPNELLDHCSANMPYFAVPRYVRFRTELPHNPSGKILKDVLRAEGITPDTWDRETAGYEVRR